MRASIKFASLAALLLVSGLVSAADEVPRNPYAGQDAQGIKALSDEEVASLLSGKGAGFAKAAELNGYPGPAHVLELAGPLRLDAAQLSATKELMAVHKARGPTRAELVASERALDRLLADKQVDAIGIDQATQQVGSLQARLRAEHLRTHLEQTAMLNAAQIHRYNVLRGYVQKSPDDLPSDNRPRKGTGHRH